MFFISHRGNLDGPDESKENHPDYINNALNKNFDVEIDVWFENNKFYLGHDKPEFLVDSKFLQNNHFWCHAKNYNALIELKKNNCHYFWHEEDKYTITSKGYFWAYPGEAISEEAICVLPETKNIIPGSCAGICSDFITNYK